MTDPAMTQLSDLVDRLRATAAQLRRMVEIASFGGDATGVRVKEPSALLEDLDQAADRIEALGVALNLAVSRGCDHCAEPIRAARTALQDHQS